MAKGQPDFGALAQTETIGGLADLGELAARLGSIVTFDRRGNIIWLDNFESGINQWLGEGDLGYSIDWEGNLSKTGGFSCKLTTAAVEDHEAQIIKYIGFQLLSAIGFECSFAYQQNWKYLKFLLWMADGSYLYQAAMRYDRVNYKWQYLSDDSAYYDVPSGPLTLPAAPTEFDTMKFVADFATAKYKRLIVNSQEVDLSTLSFVKYAAVTTPHMALFISLSTKAAAAAIGYIDDVIVTQNEP